MMQPQRRKLLIIGIITSITITVGIFVGVYLVRQEQLKRSRASSGANCTQSPDCELVNSPGDRGSRTMSRNILRVDLTDQDVHSFNPGETDDGCRKVNISGKSFSWERYGSGSECKQISNLQIWLTSEVIATATPVSTPSANPSMSPTPTATARATATPSPTPPGIGGGSPTPTPTSTPSLTATPSSSPNATAIPGGIGGNNPTSTPSTTPNPTSSLTSTNGSPSSFKPQATPISIPNAGTISVSYILLGVGVLILFGSLVLLL